MSDIGNRYWIASSSGNWSNANNWSQTDGGAGGASVPIYYHRVYFNGNGLGDCYIDRDMVDLTGAISSLSVNSGYSGNITLNTDNVSVIGDVDYYGQGTLDLGDATVSIGKRFNCQGNDVVFNTAQVIVGGELNISGITTFDPGLSLVHLLGSGIVSVGNKALSDVKISAKNGYRQFASEATGTGTPVYIGGDLTVYDGGIHMNSRSLTVSGDIVVNPDGYFVHEGISGTTITTNNIYVTGRTGSGRQNFVIDGGVNLAAASEARFDFANVGNVTNDGGSDIIISNFCLTESVNQETYDYNLTIECDSGDYGNFAGALGFASSIGEDYFKNRCCRGCDSSGTPVIIQITIQDMASGDCATCSSYNGTYTLHQVYNFTTSAPGDEQPPLGVGQGTCTWITCFDDPCNPGMKAILGFQLGGKGGLDGSELDALKSQIFLNTNVDTTCCQIVDNIILPEFDSNPCMDDAGWSSAGNSYLWSNPDIGTNTIINSTVTPTNCFLGIVGDFDPFLPFGVTTCDASNSLASIVLASGSWVECPFPACCCGGNNPESSRPPGSGTPDGELDRCWAGWCQCPVYLQFDMQGCRDRSDSLTPGYASLYGDGTACGTFPCEQAVTIPNIGDCAAEAGDWCIAYDCTAEDEEGDGILDDDSHPYGTESIRFNYELCSLDGLLKCDPRDCILSSHEIRSVGDDAFGGIMFRPCGCSECGPCAPEDTTDRIYRCMTGPLQFIFKCNFPKDLEEGATIDPLTPSLYSLYVRVGNCHEASDGYTDDDCDPDGHPSHVNIPNPLPEPEDITAGFDLYYPLSVIQTPPSDDCPNLEYGIELVFHLTDLLCQQCVRPNTGQDTVVAPLRPPQEIYGDICDLIAFPDFDEEISGQTWGCPHYPIITISLVDDCPV
jgi:hypothetical protein